TPPHASSYTLRIPDGTKDMFLKEIESIPEGKRITWRKHEVKPGETLTSIAAIYHTSVSSIAGVNSISSDSKLNEGQKIIIPIGRSASVSYAPANYASQPGNKRYYAVRKGDTLYQIATRFGASVDNLCLWNGLNSESRLHPGQSLIVKYTEPKSSSSDP